VKKPWPSWHGGRVGEQDRKCGGDTAHHRNCTPSQTRVPSPAHALLKERKLFEILIQFV
jgi:hypothetical protein